VYVNHLGSGKGTYAKHCAPLVDALHVSTGDIIRKEAQSNTSLGNELKLLSNQGRLVPDDLIINIMAPTLQTKKSIIFDGFPRTVAQAKLMQNKFPVDIVISINMRRDALMRKSLGRRVCPTCNKSYNVENIDEPNFKMPAVLPTKPECISSDCISKFTQREVN
jgi:adenylate kinase